MLGPSFLMGCLPTYNQAGWWGTGVLIFLRLLQGIAVGGELVGAFIFTVEATRGERRGFWGSVCKASGSMGTTLGMGTVAFLRYLLSTEQMRLWGWRIPFLVGIIFGLIGVYLRRGVSEEGGELHDAKQSGVVTEHPTVAVFKYEWRQMVVAGLASSFWGVGFYSCFVWMGYFLSDPHLIGGEGVNYAWQLNFLMNFALVFVFPFAGMLGDYVGVKVGDEDRGLKIVMILGALFMVTFAVPCFLLICTRQLPYVIIGLLGFVVSMALFGANLPAFMCSLFSPHLRYSGVGIAYNLANAVFSGTAPVVQTALVLAGSRLNSSYYLIAAAMLALFSLVFLEPPVRRHILRVRNKDRAVNKQAENGEQMSPLYSWCADLDNTDHSSIESLPKQQQQQQRI